MDLSFEEKSVWGSLLAIGLSSWLFFPAAFAHVNAGAEPAGLLGRVVFVVGVLIAVEVVYHTIIGASSRAHESDERDALISLRADRNAGFVLGFTLFWIIGLIMFRSMRPDLSPPEAFMIAIYILLALTVSEAAKLVSQIWYYRAGV